MVNRAGDGFLQGGSRLKASPFARTDPHIVITNVGRGEISAQHLHRQLKEDIEGIPYRETSSTVAR